jgi:hypothetical protein
MLKAMARLALVALCLAAGLVLPARAEKRVALLIGNAAYENVPRLYTTINDARAVGASLSNLGFSVTVVENQTRRALSEAFIAFDKAIEPGDVAFLFFAGHGFEIHGQNYLLPIDVPPAGEGQEELIIDASFTADRLISRMQARGARTVIVVLDACRNNPFERPGGRGIDRGGGLASMTPVEGVFIVFAAGAKQIALDQLATREKVQNSVFTRNFVRQLEEPGLTLVQIAKRLQSEVRLMAAAVGHEQTPAYYDQVVGDVVLNPATGVAQGQVTRDALPKTAAMPTTVLPKPLLRPEIGDGKPEAPADPAIEELDALAAAQSWGELTHQLIAVKPTARDARWASLAEQAAIGELSRVNASSDHFSVRLGLIEHYVSTFPSLKNSRKFLDLRASIGLGAFEQCFADAYDGLHCYRQLESFVRAVPTNADLVRGAARIAGRGLNQASAAPLLAIAAGTPEEASICAEPQLAGVLVAALGQLPDMPAAKAGATVADACWNTVGTAIVAQVAREGAGSFYFNNACPMLMRRNALTGLRAARCQEVLSR